MDSPKQTTSPSSSISNATLLRRRDKRRHSATTAPFNWSDLLAVGPAEVVALAVRFDESRGDEALLHQPLETGRLYDNHQEFLTALHYLRSEQTTSPVARLSNWRFQTNSDPPYAVTPIILSGLLTAIEEQRDEGSNSELFSESSTSELVQLCQAMRQAALSRIRLRKKRRKVRRVVVPVLCLSLLLAIYWRTMSVQRHLLLQLDYVRSCDSMPAYSPACRLAESWLWFKYRDYLLKLDGIKDHFSFLQQRYTEAPLAIHTTLTQNLISWHELNEGFRLKASTRPKTVIGRANHRWLGETVVNRLVREAIEQHLSSKADRRILDVGCGIGGTLYAVLPTKREKFRLFGSYVGVSASAAEIQVARLLYAHHDLKYDVDFWQQSFDQKFPASNYTVALAIESVSYSRNLGNTVDNIINSLVKGGVLVVVDDVVYPDVAVPDIDTTFRPSLLPHTAWMAALEAANCKVVSARDLSLEYEVDLGPKYSSYLLQSNPVWGLFPFSVGAPVERFLASTGNAASQRWIELQDERTQLLGMWKRRQVGYGEGASLSYTMYVCVKA
jgi:SAM-dependent methyltransferase